MSKLDLFLSPSRKEHTYYVVCNNLAFFLNFSGLICHLMRFDTRLQAAGFAQKNLGPLTLKEQFFYPMIFYVVWQLFQLFIQFTVIEKDQTLVTSLRYLAKDQKNPMTKFFTKLAIFLGK